MFPHRILIEMPGAGVDEGTYTEVLRNLPEGPRTRSGGIRIPHPKALKRRDQILGLPFSDDPESPFLISSSCHKDFSLCHSQRDGGGAFIGLSCLPSCPLVPTGALKLMHYK